MAQTQFSTHDDVRDLGATIARMDGLSQAGFGAIAETARKALEALEQEGVSLTLRKTLNAIREAADMAMNDYEAEVAGHCHRVPASA